MKTDLVIETTKGRTTVDFAADDGSRFRLNPDDFIRLVDIEEPGRCLIVYRTFAQQPGCYCYRATIVRCDYRMVQALLAETVKGRDEAEKTPEIELKLENGTPWRLSLDRFVRVMSLNETRSIVVSTPRFRVAPTGSDVVAMSVAEVEAAVDRARAKVAMSVAKAQASAPPARPKSRFVYVEPGVRVNPEAVCMVTETLSGSGCYLHIAGRESPLSIPRPADDVVADLERALAAGS